MMYSTYEPTLIAPLVLERGRHEPVRLPVHVRQGRRQVLLGRRPSSAKPTPGLTDTSRARRQTPHGFVSHRAARRSNRPSGRRFSPSPTSRRSPTAGWRGASRTCATPERRRARSAARWVPTPSASSSPAIASWARTEASRGLAGASRPRWPFLSTRALPSRGSRSPHAARRSRGSFQPSRPASRSSRVLAMSFSYTRSHIQGSLERAKTSSNATQRTSLFSSGFLRRASEGSATNRYVTLR